MQRLGPDDAVQRELANVVLRQFWRERRCLVGHTAAPAIGISATYQLYRAL